MNRSSMDLGQAESGPVHQRAGKRRRRRRRSKLVVGSARQARDGGGSEEDMVQGSRSRRGLETAQEADG